MSAYLIIGLLLAAFYAFIAYAPDEVIKLAMAASWALLALSAIVFPLIALFR